MINKQILRKVAQSLTLSGAILLSSTAAAAPGTLPDAPLFLTKAVEPNVFYSLDDSGSMEWEVMMADAIHGIQTSSGIPILPHARYYVIPNTANGYDGYYSGVNFPYTAPSTTQINATWLIRNYEANKIYYNPNITYIPWAGSNATGTALHQDASPTAALVDPDNPGFGTVDLTADINYTNYIPAWLPDVLFPATYFKYTDAPAGAGTTVGIPDTGDTPIRVEIKPASAPFESGRSYNDEIQNFANWFQYYRKRSYIAKGALGQVINNTDATRMGLDAYNSGHQANAESMTTPALKQGLLNSLYDMNISCGPGKGSIYPNTCFSTPSRSALDRVGRLFQGSTSNPSPIQSAADGGECQQNFGVVMSDGFWNGPTPSGIGNADLDTSGVTDNGFDGDKNESVDDGNYEDSFSVTLADVAMHYYETDLSALPDKVPVQADVDEADHQHLVTYTIGFGVNGTLDPTKVKPTDIGFNWPNPTDIQDEERVDDLWHAAYNGRGKFLSASNPVELQKALNDAIQDIADRTATAAAVAVNSARLTSQSVVYLAQFNSNRWQGDLLAFPIIDLTLGTLSTTPKWAANSLLTGRDLVNEPRQIITFNGTKGVPFQWDKALLSSNLVNDLKTSPSGGVDADSIAESRLEYLRGIRTNEGSGLNFRTRASLLGDIVNSGPVFVGEATLGWPDVAPFPTSAGTRYSDFKAGLAKSRTKVVYAGSNDGMLHAFDDNTGKEILGYVPEFIATTDSNKGYHYLTDPNYTHNWYVDLTPTLSDVFMTTNFGSGWHTILIGGVRGGGRGLFALDVTDPSKFDESNAADLALWEFSSANDTDLGYTYSRPTIALANNNRWVAIFGNGYNDLGSGEAQLFIVDIEAGIDGWTAGDYIKISTKVGSATDRNGLATPALADVDGDGTVDRVYAGDLKGNMWAFDLSSSSSGQWKVAYKSGATPTPLFTTPTGKPISAKPVLSKHPTIPFETNKAPNLMVYFGTGQYIVDTDKSTTSTQSFYGVWDKGDKALLESDLIEQTFSSSFTDRVLTNNFVDYSIDHGWRFDFPIGGERSVTSPIARADTVFFNTFIPVTDPCTVGGFGFRFAVDMVTGGSPKEPVVDVNSDGKIDSSDTLDGTTVQVAVRQDGFLPEPVFIEDLVFTGKDPSKVKKLANVPEGRFSWQELIK